MARDQRTRLNAELAHQYSTTRKRGAEATPGRSSLTGEGVPEQDAIEGELDEAELAPEEEHGGPEHEPKKSIFELPRKEPSRQPLPGSPFSSPPAAAAAAPSGTSPASPAPAPAPASAPKGPRRG